MNIQDSMVTDYWAGKKKGSPNNIPLKKPQNMRIEFIRTLAATVWKTSHFSTGMPSLITDHISTPHLVSYYNQMKVTAL